MTKKTDVMSYRNKARKIVSVVTVVGNGTGAVEAMGWRGRQRSSDEVRQPVGRAMKRSGGKRQKKREKERYRQGE